MEAIKLSPPQIKEYCQRTVAKRVELGFADYLNLSSEVFSATYTPAVESLQTALDQAIGIPSLVEPRIPFVDQARMLGIPINPTLYRLPACEQWRPPYSAWLQVFDPEDLKRPGLPFKELLELLPIQLRPATPFELLTLGFAQSELPAFLLAPDGELVRNPGLDLPTTRNQALALERHLQGVRISQYRLDEYDPAGRILVAFKDA